ncbi:phosphotransferase [bacterium]|nr:phosphotransferase [bacterium]
MEQQDHQIEEGLKNLVVKYAGSEPKSLDRLKGDASTRSIYRIHLTGESLVGVHGPNLDENRAFLSFTNTFYDHHLPVPKLYRVDDTEHFYLLEDLGDTTLFEHLNQERERVGVFPEKEIFPYYQRVVRDLCLFQVYGAAYIDFSKCYQTIVFDRQAWEFDHNYFLTMFVDTMLPNLRYRARLVDELQLHCDILEPAPRDHFLYRDFQSRNIMVSGSDLKYLDYQSGRRGAVLYDIASLLYDSRANLPSSFRDKILDLYLSQITELTILERGMLEKYFAPYALLRILQAMGSYGNNGIRRGLKEHLHSIPFALQNALDLLSNSPTLHSLHALQDCLAQIQDDKNWIQHLD